MRRIFTLVFCIWAIPGIADPIEVYSGAIPFRAEAQTFNMPLRLSAEPSGRDILALTAEVALEPVLPAANAALRAAFSAFPQSCEHHLKLDSSAVTVDGNAAAVSVGLRYRLRGCVKVFGSEVKTDILTESGTVRAWAEPFVEADRLQLRLTQFRVDDLGEVSKWLNVEDRIRSEVRAAIDKLNRDPDFAELPAPIRAEGFAYRNVALSSVDGPKLIVEIVGPDQALPFFRILAAFRDGRI